MVKHTNTLKLVDYYFQAEKDKQYLFLVTELYTIDLKTIIKQRIIDKNTIPLYLYQILKGLQYLHKRNIAHRDLSPSNILLQLHSHRIAIADFGNAKVINYFENSIAYVGTRFYRAPELIFGANTYTTQVDMWSFGCILV